MADCNGLCLPIYIYGGITFLSIGAKFLYDRNVSFGQRLWGVFSHSMIATLYGAIVYILCRYCNVNAAYLALIPPSILLGLSMLMLLFQRPLFSK